jgi:signal transduction histidine kinase
MGSPLDRRQGNGRRRSDTRDTRAVRGLLHDLGHEMTTLSYLVEAVRGDVSLPDDSSCRLELLSLEMSRLLDLLTHGLTGMENTGQREPFQLREMLVQLIRLAALTHGAQVELLPGPDTALELNPVLLWRVLSNVLDNGARAAGPGGQVTVAVLAGADASGGTVIEVADDGPGFGTGPRGTASLGLEIVTSLLEACGGSLEIGSPDSGGTVAWVRLPAAATAAAAPARPAIPPAPAGSRPHLDR